MGRIGWKQMPLDVQWKSMKRGIVPPAIVTALAIGYAAVLGISYAGFSRLLLHGIPAPVDMAIAGVLLGLIIYLGYTWCSKCFGMTIVWIIVSRVFFGLQIFFLLEGDDAVRRPPRDKTADNLIFAAVLTILFAVMAWRRESSAVEANAN